MHVNLRNVVSVNRKTKSIQNSPAEKINEQEKRLCRDCLYFFADRRETVYRREACCFCKRKGPFYSRSYRVGEKTRIDGEQRACPDFIPQKER